MAKGLYYKYHKPSIRRYLRSRDPAMLASCFAFADTKQGHAHWHRIAYLGAEPTPDDIKYLERLLALSDFPKDEEEDQT